MLETFKIYPHKRISLQEITKKLLSLGYRRFDQVAQEGDFSIRGDTLEIFPANFSYPLRVEWEFETINKIFSFDKSFNKKILDYDFLFLIPCLKKRKRYISEDSPISAVLQIKKGDYVVHSRYGIGVFCGLNKLIVRNKEDYYFEIEYENKDKLYVSREEAHLIQKYSNFNLNRPRLTRLGSRDWPRLKEKVEKGIKHFAVSILRMEAQRKIIGGFKYAEDDSWQKKFEQGFPYRETLDQAKATIDTKNDMQRTGCMDRIICGDVGYGKTEVAMRAAFKAASCGRQVAFLVPTTILAYQHYINLTKRLSGFPFYVEMLSRFRSGSEQKNILTKLKEGKIDIIVGTHRLLSGDVDFKDLGLLIIDEEHKFGVTHKDKIKKLRVRIDILSLTATPIPRTLYMSLVGLKNISLIKTPPKQRLAIKTEMISFNPEHLKDIIVREAKRGGQVFLIHNRIETIDRIENALRKVLPKELRMEVIHGRLPTKEIEEVMLEFINQKIDCLLSTAIVESGIDIPTANTIIINDAYRFGLADLHQLRGRVGRHNVQAYCYLVIPPKHSVSSDAIKRLKMIEEFSHLGAGFEIAMRDLELRGAGNILGRQQHGFIWMVGFDLYCRMLKKEIEYLKEAFKIGMS
ncbi:MAG: DEAD/DEAH box helicase [Candidatus Omnitrophica bacterium]|nr:DEAD/DEAH box helicase [Candidatus Omnitrophota bacterium]